MTAVFGEFLTIARQHTSAAGRYDGKLSAGAVAEVITELDRLFTAISGYLADYSPSAAITASGPANAQLPVIGSGLMLDRVAQHIRLAASSLPPGSASAGHPLAAELRTASDALNAGHDLLRGHAGYPEPGARFSPWQPVITSRPVAAALFSELSQIAAKLTLLLARISVTTPRNTRKALPGSAFDHLSVASGSLIIGNGPMTAAAPDHPYEKAAALLLQVIPANVPPPRIEPAGPETISELRAAITSTTARLDYFSRRPADRRDWPSPAAGTRWRHNALAAAIISHNSELLLDLLISRAGQLKLPPTRIQDMRKASDATRLTRTSAQTIARIWDTFATGTSRQPGPTGTELDDLVLRIGRLARANPAWAPSRRDTSLLRPPAELAPAAGDITDVLATVGQAFRATIAAAGRDRLAVCQAATAHGIYAPARDLPESDDLIHVYRYRPATEQQLAGVLMAYTDTITAGSQVLTAFDDLVLTAAQPDLAQAMAQNPAVAARLLAGQAIRPAEYAESPRPETGELERELRNLNIVDPDLIAQAAALDQAGRKLSREAVTKAAQRDLAAATAWAAPSNELPRRPRNGVQAAAQDLPGEGNRTSVLDQQSSTSRRSATAAQTRSPMTGRR
jgi:hypothetical protein